MNGPDIPVSLPFAPVREDGPSTAYGGKGRECPAISIRPLVCKNDDIANRADQFVKM